MVKTLDISTKKVIFDTDCLSSFLWVNEENIILDLFDGLIVIPDDVYEELSKVKSLKEKIGEKEAFSPNAVIQLFNNL